MNIHSNMTSPAVHQDTPWPLAEKTWHAAVRQVYHALLDRGYLSIQRIPTVPNLLALPLEPWNLWGFFRGHRRLMEPTAVPGFYRFLGRLADRCVERQLAFFLLGETLSGIGMETLLGSLSGAPDLRMLTETGIIAADAAGSFRSRLRFVPAGRLLLVADPFDRSIPDFAYIGRDSLYFAARLRQVCCGKQFGRALDLCCGIGVQGLTVAEFAEHVDGVDLNPRAVAYANLNAQLNALSTHASFCVGDLADGLEGPYDLIVSNPPYVLMTPEEAKTNLDGHGGGELGLDIPLRIVGVLDRLLGAAGEAFMVCNSPVVHGESVLPRLVERSLQGTRLGARIQVVRYMVDRSRFNFYKSRGVSHVRYCLVHIARRLPVGVRVENLAWTGRTVNGVYARFAQCLYGLTYR